MTLKLERVAVRYGPRTGLAPTSLSLSCGELVGLIGPNGAGKSSLLKAAAGVLEAAGSVSWAGRPLEGLPPRERAKIVAYLPQSPAAHWPLAARDLVALGRLPHRAFGERGGAGDTAAVERALAECGAESLGDRPLDELSGGERARILLARALAVEAPVLLVDEPIHSLDPYHQLQVMSVLKRYAGPAALVVAVLHDLALAARFCSRVVLLSGGAVVGDGAPADVLTDAVLARYYKVEPYLAMHDGEPVVMPWRRLG
ncbi:MAG TPA: ABC transporter ATP-binding protein [Gammaproteobacteria bacterium]|nr:ABC transporter ATP-binding protein [Gammaproteobacteria bacterium]